ncbi:MAG: ABC transporter substrate-binding protein [Bauldia sp.]|nr:ABC transporter substrate-binding protein [Bauldia sp.]
MTVRPNPALLALVAITALGMAATAEAKTLVFCPAGGPEGFDPAPFTLGTTFDASSQALYDRLVTFKPGTTEIAPGLATSWEVSPDGLDYTFHLRPGVRFQGTADFTPSRDLNADDVVFSLERQWKEDNPYFDYAGGIWPYFTGMSMGSMLRAVRKVDDETVVVTLNRPDATLLPDLAMDFASILSAEYAGALLKSGARDKLNTEPVGTGPFRRTGYEEDVLVRYAANPDYWGGKPAIDELVFDITPDATVRMEKLKAGDCDVIADPPASALAALPADTPIVVEQRPGANVAYLAFNTTEAPFDQAAVRKAVAMAIDKQAIVERVYDGAAVTATTPVPPDMWSYAEGLAGDPHNPEAARKLLADAGVSKASLRILVPEVARPYDPDPVATAGMIRDDLAAIGIKAEIVTDKLDGFLDKVADPERQGAVLSGWSSDNGDPAGFFSTLLDCDTVGITNLALWCDARFSKLIQEARALPTQEARSAGYKQAQAIFVDEAPWVAIAHAMETVALNKDVTGFVVDPLGRHRFDTVDIPGDPGG